MCCGKVMSVDLIASPLFCWQTMMNLSWVVLEMFPRSVQKKFWRRGESCCPNGEWQNCILKINILNALSLFAPSVWIFSYFQKRAEISLGLVFFHPHNTLYSLALDFFREYFLSIFSFECVFKYSIEILLCCFLRWLCLKMSVTYM